MTLRWTEEMVAKHQAKHGKNKDNNPNKGGELERLPCHVVQGKNEVQKALPRVDIKLTHYRRRLLDVDNFCTKWLIDGIVKDGILPDDSPKEVRRVTHEQVKIETWDTERIEIELTEAL